MKGWEWLCFLYVAFIFGAFLWLRYYPCQVERIRPVWKCLENFPPPDVVPTCSVTGWVYEGHDDVLCLWIEYILSWLWVVSFITTPVLLVIMIKLPWSS